MVAPAGGEARPTRSVVDPGRIDLPGGEAAAQVGSQDPTPSNSWWRPQRWWLQPTVQQVVTATVGAVLATGIGGFLVGARVAAPPDIDLPSVGATPSLPMLPTTTVATLHVHVAGAVVQPGLYRVVARSRVADVVEAAGGPTGGADLDRLNLAAPVVDGDRVEVPLAGQPLVGPTLPSAPTGRDLVDVNQAGLAELQQLPGIGPGLAAAIISDRQEHGPFVGVDDLDRVPGIGPATLERLRPQARV